jgi:hypothetical protein
MKICDGFSPWPFRGREVALHSWVNVAKKPPAAEAGISKALGGTVETVPCKANTSAERMQEFEGHGHA